MRTSHRSALALPIIMLAACGGGGGSTDIESTLRFADRTDVELSRLMNAAAGTEMYSAQGQIDQFGDTFNPDPCPVITIAGDVATVTGGCTQADGTQIMGSAVVTNPFGWDQIDGTFGEDALYEMTAFTIIQSGFTQSWDGFVRISGDFSTWDADVTTNSFGVSLRSDIYQHCSASSQTSASCSYNGSGIELIGVGGATVSGQQRLSGQTVTTDLTLKGADTMTVHVEGGCIAWEISGSDRRQVCAP